MDFSTITHPHWRELAIELSEFAAEFPNEPFPEVYAKYDEGIVPPPSDVRTFDGWSMIQTEVKLCDAFGRAEIGALLFPYTSHYAVCISRHFTYPESIDEPHLRISPYWNNRFVLIYRERYRPLEYTCCSSEEIIRATFDWTHKLFD